MNRNSNSAWNGPPDIVPLRTFIANVFFIGGKEGSGSWFLVDAGTPFSSDLILKAVSKRFGPDSQPEAIILTHGHFDHVGALEKLLLRWHVPVYAHELELPYLTGQENYAPPDPGVGGGFMSLLSPLYPRKGINITSHVRPLPRDHSIPGLSNWRWIHTPGHTKGHICLFRDGDRALLSGDAFITVKQESLLAVLTQKCEPHGPPAYFTTDWQAARRSVEEIRDLQPSVVFPGHGLSVRGRKLSEFLNQLTRNFERDAVPKRGRYVTQ